jgi:hypothetical protein
MTSGSLPEDIVVFSVERGEPLGHFELPDRVRFRRTSDERRALVGRWLVSALVSVLTAAHPVQIGDYGYSLVLVPTGIPRSSRLSPDDGTISSERRPLGPSGKIALERAERYRSAVYAAKGDLPLVTGGYDDFEILRFDLRGAARRELLTYSAPKVHSIVPFPGLDLAVSIEDDERVIKLLRWSEKAGERSSRNASQD